MTINVLIPTSLQELTNDQASVEVEASNFNELFDVLEASYPGIKNRLCDEQGKPRRFVNFYLNTEDIRFLQGVETELQDGNEVSIVPAVAGG